MNAPVFLDTNVLLYEWDASVPAKQARAAEWMRHAADQRRGRVSFQVLVEFYRVATRKLKPAMKPQLAEEYARTFLPWDPVVTDARVLDTAWRIERDFKLAWWDALIVAAAQSAGCRTLLSEDFQAGQNFDGLTVVNPFASPPPS